MKENDMTTKKALSLSEVMGEARGLALVVLPLFMASIAAELLFPRSLSFLGKFNGVGMAVGIELFAVGLLFWASAAYRLVTALRTGTLATKGAYSLCRHPIFTWWIFFILPSCALVLDSWPFALLAVIVFILGKKGAKKEEQAVTERFGSAYASYAVKTNQLVPLPRCKPASFGRYAKIGAVCIALGVFALAILIVAVKPVALGLGATKVEKSRSYASDSVIPTPRQAFTQAIAIQATAEKVWPWLVQLGYRRAGWYNVDAINGLAGKDYFYEGGKSALRIIPELQTLALGDIISLAPGADMKVMSLERDKLLFMAGDPEGKSETNAAWTFELVPLGPDSCRLISRFSTVFPGGFSAEVLNGFVNLVGGAIIQQPAMLHGLRWRAEQ